MVGKTSAVHRLWRSARSQQRVDAGPGRRGLSKIGLPDAALSTFPFPICDGAASPTRSKILEDTGDDRPAEWLWVRAKKEPDAALVVYGSTTRKQQKAERQIIQWLRDQAARLSTASRCAPSGHRHRPSPLVGATRNGKCSVLRTGSRNPSFAEPADGCLVETSSMR